MSAYIKKPVVIEARRWDGTAEGAMAIIEWIRSFNGAAKYWHPGEWDRSETDAAYITVKTLEGRMLANVGDWIIKGLAREFYPCKPDIFEQTYDPIGDTNT